MTPNERLERGADLLRMHAADTAALLDGIRLNNPDNPRQVATDADPYEDEWYNIVGTPDFAYGRALKIADAAIQAASVPLLITGGPIDLSKLPPTTGDMIVIPEQSMEIGLSPDATSRIMKGELPSDR